MDHRTGPNWTKRYLEWAYLLGAFTFYLLHGCTPSHTLSNLFYLTLHFRLFARKQPSIVCLLPENRISVSSFSSATDLRPPIPVAVPSLSNSIEFGPTDFPTTVVLAFAWPVIAANQDRRLLIKQTTIFRTPYLGPIVRREAKRPSSPCHHSQGNPVLSAGLSRLQSSIQTGTKSYSLFLIQEFQSQWRPRFVTISRHPATRRTVSSLPRRIELIIIVHSF